MVQLTTALNLRELQRYLNRIGDRWPLQVVMLGGARVADLRRAEHGGVVTGDRADVAGAERGPEYVVVLVSDGFDGMPWLERVYQARSLWDGLEMGGQAELHCYTASEFVRRRDTAPAVRAVVQRGLLLFEDTAPAAETTGAD